MPAKVERIQKHCEECNKVFEVRPKEEGKRFCSKKCKDKGLSIVKKQYEQTPKQCLYCGVNIPYKQKKNKFCDKHCANTKYSERVKKIITIILRYV